jgi:hypothetical protein
MLLNKTASLEKFCAVKWGKRYYDNLEKTVEERVMAYFCVESYSFTAVNEFLEMRVLNESVSCRVILIAVVTEMHS